MGANPHPHSDSETDQGRKNPLRMETGLLEPEQAQQPPRRHVVAVAVKIENVDSIEDAGEVYVTPKITLHVS